MVRSMGWLDEAAKRDALATYPRCSCLPFRSEGLPVALLEAMAWERAVVATGSAAFRMSFPTGATA